MLRFLRQLDGSRTVEDVVNAYRASEAERESERRRNFSIFGVSAECNCPASLTYHRHSRLWPTWESPLTEEEAASLTRDLGYKRYPNAPRVPLQQDVPAVDARLEETIRTRRSRGEFADEPITQADFTKLLQLACGVTKDGLIPRRAAPSGGALYPVETYPMVFSVAGLERGIYHYLSLEHALERTGNIGGAEEIWHVLYQGFDGVTPAAAFVLTARLPRTQAKYGERGYRFSLMESGHIAQNMLLTANALGLNAVGVGGFFDDALNFLVGIDGEQEMSTYIILVGPAIAVSPV